VLTRVEHIEFPDDEALAHVQDALGLSAQRTWHISVAGDDASSNGASSLLQSISDIITANTDVAVSSLDRSLLKASAALFFGMVDVVC